MLKLFLGLFFISIFSSTVGASAIESDINDSSSQIKTNASKSRSMPRCSSPSYGPKFIKWLSEWKSRNPNMLLRRDDIPPLQLVKVRTKDGIQEIFELKETAFESTKDLKDIDIRFGNPKVLKPIRLKHFYQCGESKSPRLEAPVIPSTKNLRFLKRLDDGRSVAAIELKPNKSPILNPKWTGNTFDDALSGPIVEYGNIPILEELSIEQADRLWSKIRTSYSKANDKKEVKRTYHLFSDYQKKADFFLDCIFSNGRLKKYRIRSVLVKNSVWTTVDQSEN